ncbi:MAG: hypothetical protein ABJH45_21745, partial [Paracoccaceae bacterium]
MKYIKAFALATTTTVVLSSTALAEGEQNYVEVDPAIGPEMHELHVYDNYVMGLPGADSGIVYDGGYDAGGNHITVFDFSNGGGGGGGG